MSDVESPSSPRKTELLEAAYLYVLEHGFTHLSLRPLARAIGSSPRVLIYLFGSKDGLIRSLIAKARADEMAVLDQLRYAADESPDGLQDTAREVWTWLSAPRHRPLVTMWLAAYTTSLTEPEGPWAGFARSTVDDWLDVLASAQSPAERDRPSAEHVRTAVLALLRGALLDLLATGDRARVTAAVEAALVGFGPQLAVANGGGL